MSRPCCICSPNQAIVPVNGPDAPIRISAWTSGAVPNTVASVTMRDAKKRFVLFTSPIGRLSVLPRCHCLATFPHRSGGEYVRGFGKSASGHDQHIEA